MYECRQYGEKNLGFNSTPIVKISALCAKAVRQQISEDSTAVNFLSGWSRLYFDANSVFGL